MRAIDYWILVLLDYFDQSPKSILMEQKKLPLRSLTFQLFVVTVLPLTILLLIITFSSTSLHHQAMRSLVGSRDMRFAQASASALSEQIALRTKLIESLAGQLDGQADPEGLMVSSPHLKTSFEGGAAIFSSEGKLLATNRPDYWIEPSETAHLQNFLATTVDDPVYGLIYRDPKNGEELIGVTFKGPDGSVAAGAFSIQALAERALFGLFDGEQPSIVIVDGDLQPRFQAGAHAHIGDLTGHPGLAETLKGGVGIAFSHSGDDERVITYAPIQPLGWALIIDEPWQEITSPLLRNTQIAPLVLVPALLLAILALIFGARQIVQPLAILADQAKELAQGNYQAVEKPAGGISEIRNLQSEMVRMSQKVFEAQNSLHSYIGEITNTQEEERRRLARELHDDTLQALIALNQRIQLTRLSLKDPQSDASLDEIQSLIEKTITNLRRLTRALRPIYLEELGLAASLEILVEEQKQAIDTKINFHIHGEARRLPSEVELALYRITQEALSNVARHAQARHASVELTFKPERQVILSIRDDGCGFHMPDSPAVFAREGSFGLLGLYERAELIGANLTIQTSPGEGVWLKVSLLP
jgi:signal transduction histidine kinase